MCLSLHGPGPGCVHAITDWKCTPEVHTCGCHDCSEIANLQEFYRLGAIGHVGLLLLCFVPLGILDYVTRQLVSHAAQKHLPRRA